MSAGIYSARARVETLLIEKMLPGGNLLFTERIDNYPGFPEGLSGIELAGHMEKHYRRFGGETIRDEVEGIDFSRGEKKIKLKGGKKVESRAVIIASGSSRRKLGVAGEKEFLGKGVSYCAVCDGAFFRDKKVAVVGGGDSALEEALYLTRFASSCYLIHRRDSFRASGWLQEEVSGNASIKTVMSAVVEGIEGGDRVERIKVADREKGGSYYIDIDGVFISVGQTPNVDFLKGGLKQNKAGYIITDYRMATSRKGVYACGDVARQALYQVVTACGEGATAAFSAYKYLAGSNL